MGPFRGVARCGMRPLFAMGAGCAVAMAAAAPAHAQSPDPRASLVTVSVVPAIVTVGEPFTVRVRVQAPKVATVRFPEVPPSADAVDPVDPRAIEDGPPGDLLDRTAVYTFVAWDVGRRIPALGSVAIAVAGRERTIPLGEQGAVEVRSLLPADTTDRVPRDARALLPLPGRLWQYTVLGVVLLALLGWLWLRHRARRQSLGDPAEPEAWVKARESFAALEALALADAGEPGRHAIAHVDVLRAYVARRFPDLKASLDAATFMAVLGTLDFPVPAHRVAALMSRDGTVRFAQAVLTAAEAGALAAEVRDIVAQLQLSHEARLRAIERPPAPRRR